MAVAANGAEEGGGLESENWGDHQEERRAGKGNHGAGGADRFQQNQIKRTQCLLMKEFILYY